MRIWILSLFCAMLMSGCGKKSATPPSAHEVQEFHAAVLDGDAAIVDRLLRAKPDMANARNAAGETPLAVAKKQPESDVADVIKKHGGHE